MNEETEWSPWSLEARRLCGQHLAHFERLTYREPDDPASDAGDLLIETVEGLALVVSAEHQRGNLVIYAPGEDSLDDLEDHLPCWTEVFPGQTDRLRDRIIRVERLARGAEGSPYDQLCGIRLILQSGADVRFGLSLAGESGGLVEAFLGPTLRGDLTWAPDLRYVLLAEFASDALIEP